MADSNRCQGQSHVGENQEFDINYADSNAFWELFCILDIAPVMACLMIFAISYSDSSTI